MARKYALLRLRAGEPEPEPVTEVNIIPVIDISLVLLVILFVTAPLLSYPTLPVDLPLARSKDTREDTLAVTYAKDGRLAVASRETRWEDLPTELIAEIRKRPEAGVVLRVDKSVPYSVVQRLIQAAKQAGAKQVSLGTETLK